MGDCGGRCKNKESSIANEIIELKQSLKVCCCKLSKKKDKCLCKATSSCNVGEVEYADAAITQETTNAGVITTVDIPANACITKIQASAVQVETTVIWLAYQVNIYNENGKFFCHRFFPNEYDEGAELDTTLVHPLCVGPNGATAKLKYVEYSTPELQKVKEGESSEINSISGNTVTGTLTIVYCEECCK